MSYIVIGLFLLSIYNFISSFILDIPRNISLAIYTLLSLFLIYGLYVGVKENRKKKREKSEE